MNKTYRVKWTSNAKEDLLSIVNYIKQDSIDSARRVYKKIKNRAESSNFLPYRGRVVPELQRHGITIYRELIENPWRIVYKIENRTIYIMAILDSRQNIKDLLFQKLLKVDNY